MTTLSEDRQHLDFDDGWIVVKWDERAEFTTGLRGALQRRGGGVKAADVVGVGGPRDAKVAFVAELKDFENPRMPREQAAAAAARATSDGLLDDLVRKVIDTLCGVTFAHDSNHARGQELAPWRLALASPTTRLLVLFCIEVPRSQAVAVGPWTKRLQQRLHWLGPQARVLVTSSAKPFHGAGLAYRIGARGA